MASSSGQNGHVLSQQDRASLQPANIHFSADQMRTDSHAGVSAASDKQILGYRYSQMGSGGHQENSGYVSNKTHDVDPGDDEATIQAKQQSDIIITKII